MKKVIYSSSSGLFKSFLYLNSRRLRHGNSQQHLGHLVDDQLCDQLFILLHMLANQRHWTVHHLQRQKTNRPQLKCKNSPTRWQDVTSYSEFLYSDPQVILVIRLCVDTRDESFSVDHMFVGVRNKLYSPVATTVWRIQRSVWRKLRVSVFSGGLGALAINHINRSEKRCFSLFLYMCVHISFTTV